MQYCSRYQHAIYEQKDVQHHVSKSYPQYEHNIVIQYQNTICEKKYVQQYSKYQHVISEQ